MNSYSERIKNLITQYNALERISEESITEYSSHLQAIRTNYFKTAYVDKPIITIPAVFNRTYDENFISDYLAYILHPVKSGLGYSPIKSLLHIAQITIPISALEGTSFEIIREYQLSENSRIDILLILRKLKIVIAIENKIYSNEGYNQTIRYSENISQIFHEYTRVLFFLTPSGVTPKSSDFQRLSYSDLLTAFRTIVPAQLSERDRFFFSDFLLHVENYIMKSADLRLSEKSKLYLENFDMIKDIQSSFSQDTSNIFRIVSESIISIVEATGDDWEHEFSDKRDWQACYNKHRKKKEFWVYYLFMFSKESLFTDSEIMFSFDTWGKGNVFLESFDKIYPSLKSQYQKASIQYRPPSRRSAIGYKTYTFQLNPASLDRSEITTFFQKIIDEFNFLVDPIDKELNKFE